MFHGVIQKITLAQFFLRHGVQTEYSTGKFWKHEIQMQQFIRFIVTKYCANSFLCVRPIWQIESINDEFSWPGWEIKNWIIPNNILTTNHTINDEIILLVICSRRQLHPCQKLNENVLWTTWTDKVVTQISSRLHGEGLGRKRCPKSSFAIKFDRRSYNSVTHHRATLWMW